MAPWFAIWIQSGTNARMYAEADSREELELKIWGQAYAPKKATISIYPRRKSS